MNLPTNRNRHVGIESRLVVAKEEGPGGRIRVAGWGEQMEAII